MAKHIEDNHQSRLIGWSKTQKLPMLDHIELDSVVFDYLYAIPNGGRRNLREAVRLKAQGVKSGVSDLHLALPLNGLLGLWIEMKKPIVKGEKKPTVSLSQRQWLQRMNKAGFKAVVCFGLEEAKEVIVDYISIKTEVVA
jgi:hypothetical protein